MDRRYLGWILLAALSGASGLVRAQAKSGDSAPRIAAERQRLKTELERVNAEIDSLKRDSRSVRDDYLLRNRMADAEALARRLTALDARLPAAATKAQRSTATPWIAPEASPADDRAVLEAKADILTDQARRLNSQADFLAGRVTDLRARNELRRRAGQLERDPFSALEQAKRRLTTAGTTTPGQGTTLGGPSTGASAPPPVNRGGNDTTKDTTTDPSTGVGPGLSTAGTTPQGSSTGSSTTMATGSGSTSSVGVTSSSSSSSSSGSKAQPSVVPPTQGSDSPGSVALQFRGILDAATLAEIRRLEDAAPAGGSLPAMEHALAALRARAVQLSAKANALRTSAKTAP